MITRPGMADVFAAADTQLRRAAGVTHEAYDCQAFEEAKVG